jgi:hypothetical protein
MAEAIIRVAGLGKSYAPPPAHFRRCEGSI